MAAIYHISDLHIEGGLIDKHRNDNVKKLVRGLAEDIAEDNENEPVVVITGDITDSGDNNEYAEARKILALLLSKAKIRIVPGNHDVGGMFGTSFKMSAADNFDKFAKGYGQNATFKDKYNAQYPSFAPIQEVFFDETETPIRLIYLNTVCELKKDWAVGNIGFYQATHLESMLESDFSGITVICMHHKPVTPGKPEFVMDLNIEDRKLMMHLMKTKPVDAILYGHQATSNTIKNNEIIRNDGKKCYLINANDSVKKLFYYKLTIEGGSLIRNKISVA